MDDFGPSVQEPSGKGPRTKRQRRARQERDERQALMEVRALRRTSASARDAMYELAGEQLAGGASATEVALALGISRGHLYRLLSSGVIPSPVTRPPEPETAAAGV